MSDSDTDTTMQRFINSLTPEQKNAFSTENTGSFSGLLNAIFSLRGDSLEQFSALMGEQKKSAGHQVDMDSIVTTPLDEIPSGPEMNTPVKPGKPRVF